jgi:hypothetical protein
MGFVEQFPGGRKYFELPFVDFAYTAEKRIDFVPNMLDFRRLHMPEALKILCELNHALSR